MLISGAGASKAAEIEKMIQIAHDGDGSAFHVEISREGVRQTATPVLSVTEATMEKASKRILESVRGYLKRRQTPIPVPEAVSGSAHDERQAAMGAAASSTDRN